MEKIIHLLVILAVLSGSTATAGLKGKIDGGNKQYRKDNFEGALSSYRDAQIDEPEHPILHFNSGDALFKTEKYEEAVKEYEKAGYSKDIEVQAKSYYNTGNSLYRAGKMPEAIQYYQKCLELNPKDQDAKYNIEFVRKKIKEELDKNKQQGQQGKDGKDGKDSKDKQKKEAEQKAKEVKENKDKKEDEQKAGGEKKEKMSKEDAERILKAISEDEKNNLDKKKEQNSGKFDWGMVEQDW